MVRARQIDIPEDSQETSNLSLVQDSAHRTMGGFPYVESIGKNNIGMICIINVLEESDLHFSQGGNSTGSSFILNIQTVPVYGEFGGKDDLDNELHDVLLFDRDVIEEYRGRFKGKSVTSDEVDNFLGELPVSDSIGA